MNAYHCQPDLAPYRDALAAATEEENHRRYWTIDDQTPDIAPDQPPDGVAAEIQFAAEDARAEIDRALMNMSPSHPAFGAVALARLRVTSILSAFGVPCDACDATGQEIEPHGEIHPCTRCAPEERAATDRDTARALAGISRIMAMTGSPGRAADYDRAARLLDRDARLTGITF